MVVKKFLPHVFWSVLILSFVVLAGSVGLVAAGYQFDWETRQITQTGLLYFAGQPRDVTVSVNGKIVAERLPIRLSSVVPGEYLVTIEKEGYVPWRKRVTLAAGQADTDTDIRLFLEKPELSQVTDPAIIRKVQENTKTSPLIYEQEIRVNNKLVTRVSGELKAASVTTNRSHVFFQVGKEIRVIEIEGTNELLLHTLTTDTNSQLIILEDGKELAITDAGTVKRLRVR